MGRFVKKGNEGFRVTLNSEFVDKSQLIEIINATLNSKRQFTCVSRARRFGKSIGAEMLYAYYDQWCDSRELFRGLKIANSPTFDQYLHRYPVIYIDMTDFVTRYKDDKIVDHINLDVIAELKIVYPEVIHLNDTNLSDVLHDIVSVSNQEKFIMIIDEWDAILRERPEVSEQYINLLRGLFKSTGALSTFAGVYMTGILPIKKYNTQSALNNFHEYSVVQPGPMAECFGFTANEVQELCAKHGMEYSQLAEWYDGYQIGGSKELFNPTSVMTALYNEYCDNYWANTGTYDTIATYIKMNFDGLKDDVIRLLAGESCSVDTASFQNDLNVVRSKDDVLTLLIHLGYLTYDRDSRTCRIPNREVATEFKNAVVADTGWDVVANAIDEIDNTSIKTMKILVTGAAGFIGSKLAYELAKRGDDVIGVDNINDYYDVRLKYARLQEILGIAYDGTDMPFSKEYTSTRHPNLRFIRLAIEDKDSLDALFGKEHFDIVVNLAAQAGVRYSITHPYTYMQSNLVGFLNILEACRNYNVPKLVFASSSSVYGMNEKVPYNEEDKVDVPVSLYAATKKSNELMAHSYSKLYGIQCIGLRFFTVYGPWGRPDMSPMLFANALREGKAIKVFNNGDMIRDFTYIDDIVEGTMHTIDKDIPEDKRENGVAYRIYNIGCSHPVKLMDFISELEQAYGEEAKKEFLPMQPGDVYQTNADTSRLEAEMGYKPHVSLHEGIGEFMKWYKSEKNPI